MHRRSPEPEYGYKIAITPPPNAMRLSSPSSPSMRPIHWRRSRSPARRPTESTCWSPGSDEPLLGPRLQNPTASRQRPLAADHGPRPRRRRQGARRRERPSHAGWDGGLSWGMSRRTGKSTGNISNTSRAATRKAPKDPGAATSRPSEQDLKPQPGAGERSSPPGVPGGAPPGWHDGPRRRRAKLAEQGTRLKLPRLDSNQ